VLRDFFFLPFSCY